MGALKPALAALALGLSLLAGPGLARAPEPWRIHVGEAAARFGLPEEWVLRVIAAESGGRTHLRGKPITSHAGAMGLMQVMPATWSSLRAEYRLGPDPYDPRDNIVAGTAYLRAMYDRFGYPGLFAAYNAGPGRYGDYLARGRPLPRETRDYVAQIVGTPLAPPRAEPRRKARLAGKIGVALAATDSIFLTRNDPSGAAKGGAGEHEKGADRAVGATDPLFLLRKPDADRAE